MIYNFFFFKITKQDVYFDISAFMLILGVILGVKHINNWDMYVQDEHCKKKPGKDTKNSFQIDMPGYKKFGSQTQGFESISHDTANQLLFS